MEKSIKKCSHEKHDEIVAICYCQECKINLCNKCQNHHLELFQNHHEYKFGKNFTDIFSGFCKEKNHFDKLEFFCNNHNVLCCTACISKIKIKGKGQHTNCNVCTIEDVKNEKRKKLKENIKYLEDLSNTFQQSINELKIIFDKICEKKEEFKLKIQKIFTKVRNKLNEREDELLLEIDKQFDNLYFNDKNIKDNENLPNKIKISLEKGKIIDNKWNDNKNSELNSLINDCIDIEKNIENIKTVYKIINKYNSNKNILNIKFINENENSINKFIEKIKTFVNISYYEDIFRFKKCSIIGDNDKKNI